MKLLGKLTMVAAGLLAISLGAMADDTTATATTTTTPAGTVSTETATEVKSDQRSADLYTYVQTRYSLTDAQIADLKNAKLNSNQTLRVAELAKMSGKSVEDIIKMRYEQKMGWGKIAKELNLREKEVSHAVNKARSDSRGVLSKDDMRKDRLDERAEDQADKREEHADKMKSRGETRKQSGLNKGPGSLKGKH